SSPPPRDVWRPTRCRPWSATSRTTARSWWSRCLPSPRVGHERPMSATRTVPTAHGDARLVRHRASTPVATVLLSHGAGGGIDAADLVQLADELPRQAVSVLLLEMPWRVVGKR